MVLRKDLRNSKRAAFATGILRNFQVQWESYFFVLQLF